MVSVAHRMTMLTKLLKLKVGPGAIILPPDVKKIHMDFAIARDDGHVGARLFWRNELRRIKYYNPALQVSISRTKIPEDPALMTIFFANPESPQLPNPSKDKPEASTPTPKTDLISPIPEKTEVFDIKNRESLYILDRLLKLTQATPVKPTEEQLQQLEFLEGYKLRSIKDTKRTVVRNRRLKLEREKEILMKGGLPA